MRRFDLWPNYESRKALSEANSDSSLVGITHGGRHRTETLDLSATKKFTILMRSMQVSMRCCGSIQSSPLQ
jgi:hypothetical protein